MRRTILAALVSLSLAACGGAATSPISADAPHIVTGQTINAVTGAAAGSLVVWAGTGQPVTSEAGVAHPGKVRRQA